jgi:hypothetical protein
MSHAPVDQAGHQLLRILQRGEKLSGQARSNAHLQAEEQAHSADASGGGETGSRYSDELALVYERARQRGTKNRATLAAARKMVAYMLAVERRKQNFVLKGEFSGTAAA